MDTKDTNAQTLHQLILIGFLIKYSLNFLFNYIFCCCYITLKTTVSIYC